MEKNSRNRKTVNTLMEVSPSSNFEICYIMEILVYARSLQAY